MRDPLAPENSYDHLNLSMDATPDKIEKAYDHFVENNPGKEIEATQMWDELRLPESRLMLDIFQYQLNDRNGSEEDFIFEIPQIRPEDIDQIKQSLMNEFKKRKRKIDFGPNKNLLDLF